MTLPLAFLTVTAAVLSLAMSSTVVGMFAVALAAVTLVSLIRWLTVDPLVVRRDR